MKFEGPLAHTHVMMRLLLLFSILREEGHDGFTARFLLLIRALAKPFWLLLCITPAQSAFADMQTCRRATCEAPCSPLNPTAVDPS
jgi:hypothetical protein